ncbi:MAG: hypothetical protein ACK56K_01065, partial [Akkermansiaceae bacterium]
AYSSLPRVVKAVFAVANYILFKNPKEDSAQRLGGTECSQSQTPPLHQRTLFERPIRHEKRQTTECTDYTEWERFPISQSIAL